MIVKFWFLVLIGSTVGYLQNGFEDASEKQKIPKFEFPLKGNLAEPFSESDDDTLEVTQHTVTQFLDHFNTNDNTTWQQRYWNNSNFFEPGGPIFLIIGGNSEMNEKWISNPNVTYLQWAKSFKAMIFLLEHRFYGKSRPTNDLSFENLQYLSSKQALEDILHFISTFKEEYPNSKWVTFGGLYGGSLAAWFKKRYPESSEGAVASSAPFRIKTNFFEYLQVVQRSIQEYDDKCAQNIASAFLEIFESLFDSNKTAKLNSIFKLSKNLLSSDDFFHKDSQMLFSSIISSFQVAAEYNGINANLKSEDGIGIENVCEIMIQDLNFEENLQKVYTFINPDNDIIDSDYLKKVELLNDTSFDGIKSQERAWLWQSCTEFGHFQTTDLGRNIFGSTVSVDFFIDLCTDVFGLEREDIDAAIDSTKQFYGELTDLTVTNVALLYGSEDPFHALGKYTDTTSIHGITSFFINGTSTCADLYPANELLDPPELVSARADVEKLINYWIH